MAGAAQLAREESAEAEVGVTTIGGGEAAVLTRGEDRSLPVYGPGGLVWTPKAGDTVLVIKGGSGREEQCIAGALARRETDELEPGELRLYSGGASLTLRNDGTVEIYGRLMVNGSLYVPCLCGMG
ncbi:MAG: hypothetical protein HFF60_01690 [Oscillospiraceae bacterium]|jgi:hypothetical protein|nr:hypothetical protein [Oscillospiraceae bacterium]MCI9586650.1 hypothetical protein [Oscillospiraceae bacterium]